MVTRRKADGTTPCMHANSSDGSQPQDHPRLIACMVTEQILEERSWGPVLLKTSTYLYCNLWPSNGVCDSHYHLRLLHGRVHVALGVIGVARVDGSWQEGAVRGEAALHKYFHHEIAHALRIHLRVQVKWSVIQGIPMSMIFKCAIKHRVQLVS